MQINDKTVYLNLDQVSFNNTVFSFPYQERRVLHFTNLNSVLSILKSKEIRASNLNRFDDNLELLHSIDLINSDIKKWESEKNYVFAASFTNKIKQVNYNNYHYHWDKYANCSKGCALEFEIIRTPLPPCCYSLVVNYVESIEDNEILKNLNETQVDDVVLRALLPLLATFKTKSNKEDNEIRLFSQSRSIFCEKTGLGENPAIDYTLSDINEFQYFYKLPFVFPNEETETNHILKLHAVHIGNNCDINDGHSVISNYLEPVISKNNIEIHYI